MSYLLVSQVFESARDFPNVFCIDLRTGKGHLAFQNKENLNSLLLLHVLSVNMYPPGFTVLQIEKQQDI